MTSKIPNNCPNLSISAQIHSFCSKTHHFHSKFCGFGPNSTILTLTAILAQIQQLYHKFCNFEPKLAIQPKFSRKFATYFSQKHICTHCIHSLLFLGILSLVSSILAKNCLFWCTLTFHDSYLNAWDLITPI